MTDLENIKHLAMAFIGFVIRGVILACLILLVYRAGQYAYDFGFRIFTEPPMTPEPGRDVAITIVRGDSVMDVGEMLEEKGLIRDAKLFYVQKKCSVYDGDIKPGFYTLNTSMNVEDMFGIIAGFKDGESHDEEEEEDEGSSQADPLTQADPLIEQSNGEWEGAEENEADVEAEIEAQQAEGQDATDGGVEIDISPQE